MPQGARRVSFRRHQAAGGSATPRGRAALRAATRGGHGTAGVGALASLSPESGRVALGSDRGAGGGATQHLRRTVPATALGIDEACDGSPRQGGTDTRRELSPCSQCRRSRAAGGSAPVAPQAGVGCTRDPGRSSPSTAASPHQEEAAHEREGHRRLLHECQIVATAAAAEADDRAPDRAICTGREGKCTHPDGSSHDAEGRLLLAMRNACHARRQVLRQLRPQAQCRGQ